MPQSPLLFRALFWLLCASCCAFAEEEVQEKVYTRPKVTPVRIRPRKVANTAQTTPAPAPEIKKSIVSPENDVREVLFTRDYILLSEIDPIPEDVITWDKTAMKFLYIANEGAPFIFFLGRLKEGYELNINDEWVAMQKGRRFAHRLEIPLEPGTITIKLFRTDRTFQIYRINYVWTKLPPAVRARVREGDEVFEKQSGFLPTFKRSAHVQLYASDKMTNMVDLDSLKHARLSVRVFLPPETEESYDSWKLIVKDEDGKVVGEVKKYGNPPPYIDFREVSQDLLDTGTYTYSLALMKDDRQLFGPENVFSTIAGNSVLDHNYLPKFSIEPREEFGYFQFRDRTGFQTSNFYVGADATVTLFHRFLLRGTAHMSIHSLDRNNFFSFARLGFGTRFQGIKDRGLLGNPHFYKLDILVSVGGHTVYDDAPIRRYTQAGILIEPQFVAWGNHYLSPSFEFAFRPNFDQVRMSLGFTYNFYIRPWNARLGIGVGYDNLLIASSNELGRFELTRGFASFAFTL